MIENAKLINDFADGNIDQEKAIEKEMIKLGFDGEEDLWDFINNNYTITE